MIKTLTHDECECGSFRPRHPILCYMDLFGLVITLLLIAAYRPGPVVAVLPLVIVGVYVASIIYHWMPYRVFWHKMDHQMIVLLTGLTFVPYWCTLLPYSELNWRLPLLILLTIIVCAFRWFWFSWSKVGGVLYLALATFSLTISFYDLLVWLPLIGVAAFWLGIFCYFINFLIHSAHRPDPWPEFFGYRETQHIFVLIGTTLQCWVVLAFV